MDRDVRGNDAREALERLMEGNRRYRDAVRNDADISLPLRAETCAQGQRPYAIVLACSDSRVVPEHIFMAGIGELFCVRVAGNVVGDAQLASVVYAASHLGARLVMVLGHTHCGAVGAAIAGDAVGSVGALASRIADAIGDERDDLAACVLNVRASVDRLRGDGEIAVLAEAAGLEVVGGVYRLEDGAVEVLEPR